MIIFTIFFVFVSPLVPLKNRFLLTTAYIRTLLNVLCLICRIDWKINGHVLNEKPVVIASNHQGLWESFFLQTLRNPLTTIIKRELVYIPFFGWALNLLSPIKINRTKKVQSAKRVISEGSKKLQRGFSILVFPEGTRKKPGMCVGKFARSAADLAIKNRIDLIPIYHDSGLYWENKKFLKNSGTVNVEIGDPVQGKNSTEMTKNLERWMNEKASMSTK